VQISECLKDPELRLIYAGLYIFFQGKPHRIPPLPRIFGWRAVQLPATTVAGNPERLYWISTCDIWQHGLPVDNIPWENSSTLS